MGTDANPIPSGRHGRRAKGRDFLIDHGSGSLMGWEQRKSGAIPPTVRYAAKLVRGRDHNISNHSRGAHVSYQPVPAPKFFGEIKK